MKKGHLKYTNDKKRNKKDNKRNFTKDAGRGAHGVYCSGGGGRRIWSYATERYSVGLSDIALIISWYVKHIYE